MKKKKTSWISFIMPYVIIIGIIVVISLVFSQGSSNRASFLKVKLLLLELVLILIQNGRQRLNVPCYGQKTLLKFQ